MDYIRAPPVFFCCILKVFLLSIGLVQMEEQRMDMRVSTVSPMVRCIIQGENNSVLLFRESCSVVDDKGIVHLSHWDLPKGKINKNETRAIAAQRIIYNKTGLFAETVTELVVRPTRFQNVQFLDHHHYFLTQKVEGTFTRDEYKKGKEGLFQWIEYQYLSCYAVRRESMAIIRFVFEGYP